MSSLVREIRYALRGFRQSPLLAGAALLSLALGIGANAAIFSLMDQVLLRNLPVKDPARLVLFSSVGQKSGFIESNYDDNFAFSYPMYCDFRDRAPAVAGVIARFPIRMSLAAGERTELVQGDLVSGNYFDVLGVGTVLGRPITPADDTFSSPNPVAVLSYQLWKSRFGMSPAVLNQPIRINGQTLTIVGVAAPNFNGVGAGEAAEVFVPITLQRQITRMFDGLAQRRGYWLNVFARLKPDVPRAQAEAALNVFWRPILEDEARNLPASSQKFRAQFGARHLSLMDGDRGISSVRDQASGPLLVLMSMAGLLLLIACANIANLLIARAAGRQKEIAIRLAIGAGRGRLLRQLLTEGVMLSLAGGLLGILAAYWTGDLVLGFLPSDPSLSGLSAQPDVRVLLFALTLSIFTGVIFGLAPSWETFRANVGATLKEQAAGAMGSSAHVRYRKVLVTAQVSLSLVLLIGAGLFSRSLFNLKQINPGFRADHLIVFSVQPSLNGYDQVRIQALYGRLRSDIAALPGVRALGMGEMQLLADSMDMTGIIVPGYEPKEGERMAVRDNFVGPNYFSAMGIPLLAGREIGPQDGSNSPKVVVINEQAGDRFFPGKNPIGRRIVTRGSAEGYEVVGVVKNSKNANLREDPQPFAYYSYTQHQNIMRMNFYVRTSNDPLTLASVLRNTVRLADPNLPVFDMKTLDRQIDENVFTERLVSVLSTFFGGLATLLAAIGLYGVMAYTVSRRTREIGLRMALGAGRGEVLGMIMRDVGLLAVSGVAIALPASFLLSRLVQSQLYNVKGGDPAVFTLASLLIVIVTAVAGLIPALRATRIDPMAALRNE